MLIAPNGAISPPTGRPTQRPTARGESRDLPAFGRESLPAGVSGPNPGSVAREAPTAVT